MDKSKDIEAIGHYGALLATIEIGLGSLLHSFKFPLTGFFLSLNQGYLLCRICIKTQQKSIPLSVSNIAAVLKSLSPAGNKLGPMLSLSMQGLLFNLGILIGIHPLGLCLGMILLSIWSFIQPLVTYYLFFGENLIFSLEFFYEKTLPFHGIDKKNLWWILLIFIFSKMILAVLLALIAWKNKGESEFQEKLTKIKSSQKNQTGSPLRLAIGDLIRPMFLLSLILTGVFVYFSSHSLAQTIWYLLRPIAIGFIFFYFSRTLTLDRFLVRLHGGRFEFFAKSCELALIKIRKII